MEFWRTPSSIAARAAPPARVEAATTVCVTSDGRHMTKMQPIGCKCTADDIAARRPD
ncbi:hypothetical protein Dimus_018296, partial [Dionaea muscipula]